MKKDLKEQLTPILDNYIDNIIKEYDKVIATQKQTEREQEKVKEYQESLKAQQSEHNKTNRLAIEKLSDEKAKQTVITTELKDEVSKYIKLGSEIEIIKKELNENLKDAKLKNENISNYVQKAKDKEHEYKTLIELLKKDQANLEMERQRVSQKEKDAVRQERINSKEKEEIAFKQMELQEGRLKVEAREIEADRIKKKYQINKMKEKNAK